jgi:hypothetical protein
MKTYRTRSGPFTERPYYKDQEIEGICLDELRAAGLYPATPAPIRIDRFIEKRFGVSPTYEDLGDGILGLTKFGSKGVQEVIVARSLDEDGGKPAERRIRTTLAHEAGHGLLHAHVFLSMSKEQSLFGDYTDPKAPKVLCRDVTGTTALRPGYDGRWWEYHANRAIGAFLLPRPLVYMALEPLMVKRGALGMSVLESAKRGEAVAVLTEVFDVNPAVAKIRLEDVYPAADENQLTL